MGAKHNPGGLNNMVKVMLKKGVVSDLAKIPHSLDLSSPNFTATVNAALKPLEVLTKMVNNTPSLLQRAAHGIRNKNANGNR